MSLIRYNHRNALADVVGSAHGITTAALTDMLERGARCTKGMLKRSASTPFAFLDLPDDDKTLTAVHALVEQRKGTYDTVLVIGMGGSSLSALATDGALRINQRAERQPKLRMIDTTDPDAVSGALMGIDAQRTLAIAISKSGDTLETVAALALVCQWFEEAKCKLPRHLFVVSNPEGGFLNSFASRHGLIRVAMPKAVGGRFSALSAVGLLPAGLLGHDIDGLLAGAAELRDEMLKSSPSANAPLMNAAIHAALLRDCGKSVSVFMPYASALRSLGAWYIQLWAESLGKGRDAGGRPRACGQTPVLALGPEFQHSQLQLFLEGPNDKLFTMIEIERFRHALPLPADFPYADAGAPILAGKEMGSIIAAQLRGTEQALTEQGRPNVRLTICTTSGIRSPVMPSG